MDVGGLSQCLIGIAQGRTSPAILDRYDEVRRSIWHEIINPVSSGNFMRVSSNPDEVADTDELIQMSKKAWHDEHTLKQQHAFAYSLCHDFSQHFDIDRPSIGDETSKGDLAFSSHVEMVAGEA